VQALPREALIPAVLHLRHLRLVIRHHDDAAVVAELVDVRALGNLEPLVAAVAAKIGVDEALVERQLAADVAGGL
jgi:hypothetical protein